jgi:hypothetical protein
LILEFVRGFEKRGRRGALCLLWDFRDEISASSSAPIGSSTSETDEADEDVMIMRILRIVDTPIEDLERRRED